MKTDETTGDGRHWDTTYNDRGPSGVSWYQKEPTISLSMIDRLEIDTNAGVIDIGGGTSFLIDRLGERGFQDLSILDISSKALEISKNRLAHSTRVSWINENVLTWTPTRKFDLWHDRAVFHFLVDKASRDRYLSTLRAALNIGAGLIVATFAKDGPTQCSGLNVERYSADELAATLGDGFEVVHSQREEHYTPNSVLQPFTWLAAKRTSL